MSLYRACIRCDGPADPYGRDGGECEECRLGEPVLDPQVEHVGDGWFRVFFEEAA